MSVIDILVRLVVNKPLAFGTSIIKLRYVLYILYLHIDTIVWGLVSLSLFSISYPKYCLHNCVIV